MSDLIQYAYLAVRNTRLYRSCRTPEQRARVIDIWLRLNPS